MKMNLIESLKKRQINKMIDTNGQKPQSPDVKFESVGVQPSMIRKYFLNELFS